MWMLWTLRQKLIVMMWPSVHMTTSRVVVCLVSLIVDSPHSIVVCVGSNETPHGTQWKATYRHECSLSAAMQRLSVTLHRWTCIAHQPRSSYVAVLVFVFALHTWTCIAHQPLSSYMTVLVFIFALHTLCPKKVYPSMFDNDFGKCGPIFKIFSPGDS